MLGPEMGKKVIDPFDTLFEEFRPSRQVARAIDDTP